MRKSNSKQRQTFHQIEPHHMEERLNNFSTSPTRDIILKPQTASQRFYIRSLTQGETPFIVAHGPAGTGKTYPAVLYALQQLHAGEISRIVITRPLVNVDEEEVGTLPGGIIEKCSPWMLPVLDILKEYHSTHAVAKLLETEVVEIAPLAFMRGRTFKNVVVILDEAQNATPKQIKALLTRIGEGSRIIIAGDIEQTDRAAGDNGLQDLVRRLNARPNDDFAVTRFQQSDIVRHRAIDGVLNLYA